MLVFEETLPGAFLQYPLNSNGESSLEVCKIKSKGMEYG